MSASCIIVIVGVLVSSFYLYYDRFEDAKKEHESGGEALESSSSTGVIKSVKIKEDDLFRLQYEQLSEAIHSRDNMTIVGGTILITSSVLLLTALLASSYQKSLDFITRLVVVSAALAIYTVWLICFNLTSNRLNNICYSKLREMESRTIPKLEINTYVLDEVRDRKWFRFLRRSLWLYLLWVLIAVSVVVLHMS